jgi:tRNA (cytidine/uridine-2'-O-)-methyltransferase
LFHIVLFEPEIPPNTGNIMRLCANTGFVLHLVGKLGFELDDKQLRRAGLDYREWARVVTHADWQAFIDSSAAKRVFLFTTRGSRNYADCQYLPGDALVFGPETRGLPQEMLDQCGSDHCLRIPMQEGSRSLNLSNTVAVVAYEAWRQQGFESGS